MKRIYLLSVLTIFLIRGYAQEEHFNEITAADFTISSSQVDANAPAVILANVGKCEFVNVNGSFVMVFRQRKRILIKSRNAFDIATVEVPIYMGENYQEEEKFADFEATVYNLENGKVVVTQLDKSSVFAEKQDKEHTLRKFTFPALKEGSIIEFQYSVTSPYYTRLRSWYFQEKYPSLWSEYNVTIPGLYSYITTKSGYLPYTIDTTTVGQKEYFSYSGKTLFGRWVMKDVPAYKSEAYVSSSRNLINRIDFYLKSINYSNTNVRMRLKDWNTTAANLMLDTDFGAEIADANGWIKDAFKNQVQNLSRRESAKKIFEYLRDNFRCNDHDAHWLSQPLKTTFQLKTGNVADINILLTAILVKHGFTADPVLLSTRNNGVTVESIPLLSQYNYVLSRVKIGDEILLLDASEAHLGFGKLPPACYNYSARVVNVKDPAVIKISADSLNDVRTTSVFIINNDSTGIFEGTYSATLGNVESFELRNKLAGIKPGDILREIKKEYLREADITGVNIDSLNQYDEPISINYDIKFNLNGEDVIYFNPLFDFGWKQNPFVAAERSFPVEMPYKIKHIYVLNMEVPKGYVIEELPKSVKVILNEKEGSFEYSIAGNKENVQLRCIFSLEKAIFYPDDYQGLRDFFANVIKKQEEQIVFRKIK